MDKTTEAARRIEAAYPDRPLLLVSVTQDAKGQFRVYAGKTRLSLVCTCATLEAAETRAIAKLA